MVLEKSKKHFLLFGSARAYICQMDSEYQTSGITCVLFLFVLEKALSLPMLDRC